jgi:hypothetical protein
LLFFRPVGGLVAGGEFAHQAAASGPLPPDLRVGFAHVKPARSRIYDVFLSREAG